VSHNKKMVEVQAQKEIQNTDSPKSWADLTEDDIKVLDEWRSALWEEHCEEHDVSRVHIEPFNVFGHFQLPDMVENSEEIVEVHQGLRHTLKLTNARLSRPVYTRQGVTSQLVLAFSRIRNLHYNGRLLCDIVYTRSRDDETPGTLPPNSTNTTSTTTTTPTTTTTTTTTTSNTTLNNARKRTRAWLLNRNGKGGRNRRVQFKDLAEAAKAKPAENEKRLPRMVEEVTDPEKSGVRPKTAAQKAKMEYFGEREVPVCPPATSVSGGPEPVEWTHTFKNILLAEIPIPSGSDFCWSKSGISVKQGPFSEIPGLFTVGGNSKVLSPHKKMVLNTDLITADGDSQVRSASHAKQLYSTQNVLMKYTQYVERTNTGELLLIELPCTKKKWIALPLVFQALGYNREKTEAMMRRMAGPKNWSEKMEARCRVAFANWPASTVDDALVGISRGAGKEEGVGRDGRVYGRADQISYAQGVLRRELLLHMERGGNRNKALGLARMAWRLFMVREKLMAVESRENLANIRYDSGTAMLGRLIRQVFAVQIKQGASMLRRLLNEGKTEIPIREVLNYERANKKVMYAMNTGNWGARRGNPTSTNVSQPLNQVNMMAVMDHLTRLSGVTTQENRHSKYRQVVTSQYALICPAATPEDRQCGLITYSASSAHHTVGCDPSLVSDLLWTQRDSLTLVSDEEWDNPALPLSAVPVYVMADKIIGFAVEPRKFVERFLELRRGFAFDPDTNIRWDDRFHRIEIWTEAGRLTRPVLILDKLKAIYEQVPDQKLVNKWLKNSSVSDKHQFGLIEYVDACEQRMLRVAFDTRDLRRRIKTHPKLKVTHMELDAAAILGVSACMVPFGLSQQGPRLTYQAAMGRHCMALDVEPIEKMGPNRLDLRYAQRALTTTAIERGLGERVQGAGSMAIFALMPCDGEDQDDSIVCNEASAQLNLFTTRQQKYYRLDERRCGSSINKEKFEPPPPDKPIWNKKKANYSHIGPSAVPDVGTVVKTNDALICKIVPVRPKSSSAQARLPKNIASQPTQKCAAIIRKGDSDPSAMVIKTVETTNAKGHQVRKVSTSSERICETGNKLADRSGQKGTVIMRRREDMPYSVEGLIPDVIINTNSIPSRMTKSNARAGIANKIALATGEFQNGETGTQHSQEYEAETSKILIEAGFRPDGMERMYDGTTGEPLDAYIFITAQFYQVLKHFACDKQRARARGPRHTLTRQPAEGRTRDGGLRIGEMERDCMISHGVAQFLVERLGPMSDPAWLHVCKTCGLVCIGNQAIHWYHCKYCNSTDGVRVVFVTYAFKLLVQELMAMGIKVLLSVRDLQQGDETIVDSYLPTPAPPQFLKDDDPKDAENKEIASWLEERFEVTEISTSKQKEGKEPAAKRRKLTKAAIRKAQAAKAELEDDEMASAMESAMQEILNSGKSDPSLAETASNTSASSPSSSASSSSGSSSENDSSSDTGEEEENHSEPDEEGEQPDEEEEGEGDEKEDKDAETKQEDEEEEEPAAALEGDVEEVNVENDIEEPTEESGAEEEVEEDEGEGDEPDADADEGDEEEEEEDMEDDLEEPEEEDDDDMLGTLDE
jgi:DNA-directed RNA polymerase II subunit RPB2